MIQIIKLPTVPALMAILAAGTLLSGAAAESEAAERTAGQKLVVAYSSISGNNAPLWVSQEKGFFKKYGLDVQSVLIESGSTAARSLVAGDVTFAHMAGAAVLQSNLQGSDAVMIAGVVNTLTFQLFTDKTINRPDLFKGKAVGVTRYGSSTDFAMRYALEKYGLDPAKDVKILQLGNMPALLSALETGKIQGAMLSAPTTLKAKKSGFSVLADLQMLGLEYQHTGVATTRSTIRSKPELVRDFMKAYVEGIHYLKTHRNESLEVLAKYLRTADKEVLEDTYDSIAAILVPEKPYPTLKGIQIMLREMAAREEGAKAARPEQFVDLTFVRELDSSGYIDNLYKSTAVAAAATPRTPPASAPSPTPTASKPKTAEVKARTLVDDKARPGAKGQAIVSEKKPAATVVARSMSMQEYTVKAGDNLSKLAGRFYNSMSKWVKIYEANKDTVKNPDYIYIGQKLRIPAEDQAG